LLKRQPFFIAPVELVTFRDLLNKRAARQSIHQLIRRLADSRFTQCKKNRIFLALKLERKLKNLSRKITIRFIKKYS